MGAGLRVCAGEGHFSSIQPACLGRCGPCTGGLLLASWPEALGMLSADHSWLKTPWFLLKSPLWHHPISKGKEKDGFS